jgi:hypothetical protein
MRELFHTVFKDWDKLVFSLDLAMYREAPIERIQSRCDGT